MGQEKISSEFWEYILVSFFEDSTMTKFQLNIQAFKRVAHSVLNDFKFIINYFLNNFRKKSAMVKNQNSIENIL